MSSKLAMYVAIASSLGGSNPDNQKQLLEACIPLVLEMKKFVSPNALNKCTEKLTMQV